MTKATWMVLVALATNLACSGTWAGQTWICSVTSGVAVDEDGTVGPPDTGDRERPTFFRLDTSTKELTLLAPKSRRGEVTKLDTVHESEGQWLLSGVERGRGALEQRRRDGDRKLAPWARVANDNAACESREPSHPRASARAPSSVPQPHWA